MRARLYIDEDVSSTLAPLLLAAGYDAMSVVEVGALSESDEEQFQRAIRDRRTVFTFNSRDFRAIAERAVATGLGHPGIIISYHQYARSEVRALRDALLKFLDEHSAEDLAQGLIVLPRATRP